MTITEPRAAAAGGSGGSRRSHRPGRGGGGGGAKVRISGVLLRAAGLLLGVLILYLAVTFVQVYQASGDDDARRTEAIVVLGAAQYNGRPSPVLEARLRHGLDLYRRGLAPVMVVTGGRRSGDTFTEATAGYNWLRDRGVPDDAILKEVDGRNTWESLSAVARFLRSRGIDEVVLVSDNYHALRLEEVAREVGLDASISPAAAEGHRSDRRLRSVLREALAVGAGRVIGYRRLTRLAG